MAVATTALRKKEIKVRTANSKVQKREPLHRKGEPQIGGDVCEGCTGADCADCKGGNKNDSKEVRDLTNLDPMAFLDSVDSKDNTEEVPNPVETPLKEIQMRNDGKNEPNIMNSRMLFNYGRREKHEDKDSGVNGYNKEERDFETSSAEISEVKVVALDNGNSEPKNQNIKVLDGNGERAVLPHLQREQKTNTIKERGKTVNKRIPIINCSGQEIKLRNGITANQSVEPQVHRRDFGTKISTGVKVDVKKDQYRLKLNVVREPCIQRREEKVRIVRLTNRTIEKSELKNIKRKRVNKLIQLGKEKIALFKNKTLEILKSIPKVKEILQLKMKEYIGNINNQLKKIKLPKKMKERLIKSLNRFKQRISKSLNDFKTSLKKNKLTKVVSSMKKRYKELLKRLLKDKHYQKTLLVLLGFLGSFKAKENLKKLIKKITGILRLERD